jgi:hypothetical protein
MGKCRNGGGDRAKLEGCRHDEHHQKKAQRATRFYRYPRKETLPFPSIHTAAAPLSTNLVISMTVIHERL